MAEPGRSFAEALRLLLSFDPELWEIIGFSLLISLSATLIALLLGLPVAALLTMRVFRARNAIIVLSNALLVLPPVVAGLAVYLLFSRSGPLGSAGILFTPAVMVIAQVDAYRDSPGPPPADGQLGSLW